MPIANASTPPLTSRRNVALALAGILALAAALRILGLSFGLPAVYNPDEVAIVARALAFAKGDLNPHNFLYPTFYFYLLFAWIGAAFAAMWATGIVPSLAAFQTMFFVDPTNIYLAGRWLGVVCGVGGVAAAYLLARRVAGVDARDARAIGLLAALFLAVAPGHVRDSHYVKHDVPVTLAIAIAQLAILRLLVTPRPAAVPAAASGRRAPWRAWDWPLIAAAVACGVAFSTHYYAVFLALPLALAIVCRPTVPASAPEDAPASAYAGARTSPSSARTISTSLITAALLSAIAFFALSPFLLVEPRTAWQDIIANRQIVVDRAVGADHGLFASAGAYARMLATDALGTPIVFATLAGLVVLLRGWRASWPLTLVLLAFPLAFLAFISNTVAASRYLNPVLPACCALAALGVWRGSQLIARTRWRPALAILLAALCAAPSLVTSVRLGLFFRQDDTRTLALRFIEATIPPDATILVQPYSVPLEQSRDSLREALTAHLGDPARASTKFALRLAAEPYPAPAYRTLLLGDGGLDQDKIYLSYADLTAGRAAGTLASARVQFVVLKRYNVPDPAVAPLHAWLSGHGRLLATFDPYGPGVGADERARVAPFLHNTDTPYDPALVRPGPGVEVWRID